jgi:F420-non-reducing hydrogenase iron-sulfur subunit
MPELISAEGKIIVFHCNASLRGKALRAHKERFPSVVFIEVPCSGTINPIVVFKSLMDGASAVVVYACPEFDCHNFDGNAFAKRRMYSASKVAETLGIEPWRMIYIQRHRLDPGLLTRTIATIKRNLTERVVSR